MDTWKYGFLFECSTWYLTSERSEKINSIPPIKHVFFCFLYKHLTNSRRRSRLNSRFKKGARGHSFMALNGARDVSAGDWRSQTHVRNYRNFSLVEEIRFFSVVEIPEKHCSLSNKKELLFLFFSTTLTSPPTPYLSSKSSQIYQIRTI